MLKQHLGLVLVICMGIWLCACGPKTPKPDYPPPAVALENMNYSVQVGAFSKLDNAVRQMQKLDQAPLQAYYFLDRDNLYKVRFGNYPSYQTARNHAERLKARGLLDSYFIVIPENYAAALLPSLGSEYLRQELVNTAQSFMGTPYRWGGSSRQSGFDCSGLTMTVYRKNGLNLPRVAAEQYRTGRRISKNTLQKGDLVFFDTMGRGRVSHVGVYIGNGRFIHAPASGRNVTTARLSDPYFRSRFVGARTYI